MSVFIKTSNYYVCVVDGCEHKSRYEAVRRPRNSRPHCYKPYQSNCAERYSPRSTNSPNKFRVVRTKNNEFGPASVFDFISFRPGYFLLHRN